MARRACLEAPLGTRCADMELMLMMCPYCSLFVMSCPTPDSFSVTHRAPILLSDSSQRYLRLL